MEIEEWLGPENKIGIDIWHKKYQFNGEDFETWLDRVSGYNPDVKNLIINKKFLFAGRVLANRGLDNKTRKSTLANCYVIPVEDNLESIFDTAGKIARTYSYGGGCGINLSSLAPKGAKVNNAANTTSGTLSFADLYNLTTGMIGQDSRRGALMLSLSSEHPDLEEFVDAKTNTNKLTKANLSVMASDKFIMAATGHAYHTLSFTRKDTGETIKKAIDAGKVFHRIAVNNWNYAEPGLLFWDRIKEWSLLSEHPDFEFNGINPCGEEPLPAYGACNLGSIDLLAYVKYGENSAKYYFDWDELKADIPIIVYAMNKVLDESILLHPLKEQQETAAKWRPVGIGCFGFASALMLLGIKYGSQDSIIFSKDLAETLLNESVIASANLASVHGPFPAYNFNYISESAFYRKNLSPAAKKAVQKYGLRNSQLLSIAPTGTISTLLGCSGGIEPIFSRSYNRKTESLHGESVTYKVYDSTVSRIMKELGITNEEDLPDYVVTAAEIDPMDRVLLQATWQDYIDASISSTVNLPESAIVEDIEEIYTRAWVLGLKGITVYRAGCAREGILTTDIPRVKHEDSAGHTQKINYPAVFEFIDSELEGTFEEYYKVVTGDLERGQWKPIAPDTLYYPVKINIGCGKVKLFIGYSQREQALQDFELRISGSGGCERSLQDLVITMSGIIRLGGTIQNIEKAFKGVRGCNSFTSTKAKGIRTLSDGNNCGNALLNAVKKFCARMRKKEEVLSKFQKITINEKGVTSDTDFLFELPGVDPSVPSVPMETKEKCCEHPLIVFEGGCYHCRNCGFSRCG